MIVQRITIHNKLPKCTVPESVHVRTPLFTDLPQPYKSLGAVANVLIGIKNALVKCVLELSAVDF